MEHYTKNIHKNGAKRRKGETTVDRKEDAVICCLCWAAESAAHFFASLQGGYARYLSAGTAQKFSIMVPRTTNLLLAIKLTA